MLGFLLVGKNRLPFLGTFTLGWLLVNPWFWTAQASGSKQFFLFPINNEGLAIMEALTFRLEGSRNGDVVPFDISLKIRSNFKEDPSSVISFVHHMGIKNVLVGRTHEENGKVRFEGTLIGQDNRLWPIAARGARLFDVVEGVVGELRKLVGIEPGGSSDLFSANEEAEDLYELGLNYRNKGHFSQAAGLFRATLDLDPDFLMARIRLAQCLLVTGEFSLIEPLLPESPAPSHQLSILKILYKLRAQTGALTEAEGYLEKAITLAEKHGMERHLVTLVLLKANHFHTNRSNVEKAVASVDRARMIYQRLHDSKGLVECKLILARILITMGLAESHERAEAYIKEAGEQAHDIGFQQYEASALFLEAFQKIYRKGFSDEEILEPLLRAEQGFLEVGSMFSFLSTRMERANFHMGQGRTDIAEALILELMPMARRHGFFQAEIRLRNSLATLHLNRGKLLEAAAILLDNVERLKRKPIAYLYRNVYNKLIPVYLRLGYYEEALGASAILIREIEKMGLASERLSYLLNNHGEIHFLLGDFTNAARYYQRSLEIKGRNGDVAGTAWTLRNVISVNIQQGVFSEVEKLLEECEALEPGKLATLVLKIQWKYKHKHYEEALAMMAEAKKDYPNQWSEGFEAIFRILKKSKETGRYTSLGKLLPNHLK